MFFFVGSQVVACQRETFWFERNLAGWNENSDKGETAWCWMLWRTSVCDLRPHQLQLPSSKCSSEPSAKLLLLALLNLSASASPASSFLMIPLISHYTLNFTADILFLESPCANCFCAKYDIWLSRLDNRDDIFILNNKLFTYVLHLLDVWVQEVTYTVQSANLVEIEDVFRWKITYEYIFISLIVNILNCLVNRIIAIAWSLNSLKHCWVYYSLVHRSRNTHLHSSRLLHGARFYLKKGHMKPKGNINETEFYQLHKQILQMRTRSK